MAQRTFGAYRQWLHRHEHSLNNIESTVQVMLELATWFVGSRSDEVMLASEASSVTFTLWTMLNESILRPGDPLIRWLAVLDVVSHRRSYDTTCVDAEGDIIFENTGQPELMCAWCEAMAVRCTSPANVASLTVPLLFDGAPCVQIGSLLEATAIRGEREGGISRYNALAAYESSR